MFYISFQISMDHPLKAVSNRHRKRLHQRKFYQRKRKTARIKKEKHFLLNRKSVLKSLFLNVGGVGYRGLNEAVVSDLGKYAKSEKVDVMFLSECLTTAEDNRVDRSINTG